MKTTAIVLSAGAGKRMESDRPKQYLLLKDKPVIYYALKAFEDSLVDETVLVVGEGYEEYCRKEIVEKYNLRKVKKIVVGGKERYNSVYNGLLKADNSDYVFIHDGARPFVDAGMIERGLSSVIKTNASIAAMPVKDTIKIINSDGYVEETPDRKYLYMVQTPQVFNYKILVDAYRKLSEFENNDGKINITDDAMIVENFSKIKVGVFEGDYKNIKITTPEDLIIANAFLENRINKGV